MSARQSLLRLHWVLSTQFGLDPLRMLRSLPSLLRFGRDLRRFRADYTGRVELVPCLHDWHEESGTTSAEYFWQDLIVARMIYAAAPERHVDVGSRVDGFVAHVASFREIEVIDVRPNTAVVPGVRFLQADMMSGAGCPDEYCDSLSCLHALEHFGLGRYGDPIDPSGHLRGIGAMARMLRRGGKLYLSVPIGVPRVEFNANRVFDPREIVAAAAASRLRLEQMQVIRGGVISDLGLPVEAQFAELASQRYALGVFVLSKGQVMASDASAGVVG